MYLPYNWQILPLKVSVSSGIQNNQFIFFRVIRCDKWLTPYTSSGLSLGRAGWVSLIKSQLAVRAGQGRGGLSSKSITLESQAPQVRWEDKVVPGLLRGRSTFFGGELMGCVSAEHIRCSHRVRKRAAGGEPGAWGREDSVGRTTDFVYCPLCDLELVGSYCGRAWEACGSLN